MSIQKQMVEQLYGLAEKAQTPDQIRALQQQIARSIQDGAIEAYAGVPLVQDLTGRLQKAIAAQQMAAQPQSQGINQPPIAQEVLAQARGLDRLPSNLPAEEQGYAGGGIVAFASGDLVDDDDETDDDRQEASLMSLMDAARAKITAGLGSATSRFTNALPSMPSMLKSYEAAKAAQPTATAPTEGGLSGLFSSAATKHGLPVALLSRVAGSESSGKTDAANPRSSAKGLFQFTDKTWAGMGGKPGEQFNAEINTDLGAKYLRQNAEHLKKALGRDPNFHEVYAAHMFGPGVAKMLNKANPKDPIEKGLALFESPKQVKAIMKANPNLRGKTVGQVMDTLQLKTGQGIVPLAAGGAIKHYAKAGVVESGTENPYAMFGDIGASSEDYPESNLGILDWWKRHTYGTKENIEANAPKVAPTAEDRERQSQMEYQDLIEGPQERDRAERDRIAAAKTAETTSQNTLQNTPQEAPQSTEVTDPYLEKYMSMLQKRETEAEKQKELDAYLAVLQAGLGMMGGSSPYALQNIGQGGAQGISAYAAAQKQRAAEEAATLAGYGKLYTAKQAADLRRELSGQNRDLALTKLKQDKELKLGQQIGYLEKSFDSIAERNVKTALGNGFNDLDENQKLQAIAKESQRLRAQSRQLKNLYKELGMPEIDIAEPENRPLSKEQYVKMFGLAPGPKK